MHNYQIIRIKKLPFLFLLCYLCKQQFDRREKNEKEKVIRTKRNNNLLLKIVVSFLRQNLVLKTGMQVPYFRIKN